MGTDNGVMKACGGGGGRLEETNGGEKGASILLSIRKINFKKQRMCVLLLSLLSPYKMKSEIKGNKLVNL